MVIRSELKANINVGGLLGCRETWFLAHPAEAMVVDGINLKNPACDLIRLIGLVEPIQPDDVERFGFHPPIAVYQTGALIVFKLFLAGPHHLIGVAETVDDCIGALRIDFVIFVLLLIRLPLFGYGVTRTIVHQFVMIVCHR